MPELEISDLITRHDPVTGAAIPVARAEVLDTLRSAGNRRAARIVSTLPHRDGYLDQSAVDRVLIRAHTELQRLNEELRIAHQIAELLRPLLAAVARPGARARIVDVGCGIGYVIRWLAAHHILGDVELYGVDFNRALVDHASWLAAREGLTCRFIHGNAFELTDPATIYISSGVLHHLRRDELPAFFQGQEAAGAEAYCHFDVAATRLSPVGAWIFHRARMREPLGRHDGVMSARRAHDDHTLMTAADTASDLVPLLYRPVEHTNPFCASVRPIVGIRRHLLAALQEALGEQVRHVRTAVPPARRPW